MNTYSRIDALAAIHDGLGRATMRWASGRPTDDDAVTQLRRAAIGLVHRRLMQHAPRYQALAALEGIDADADFEAIATHMLSPDQIFKSYPQAALDAGDFDAMSQWLRQIYTGDIEIETDDLPDVDAWMRRLADQGVQLVFSSGTSGRLSFVPRDAYAWDSFHRIPYLYAPLLLARRGIGAAWQQGLAKAAGRLLPPSAFLAMFRRLGFRDFDGVMLSFSDGRQGIQLAGTQLAALTRTKTFLYDTEITAAAIRAITRGPRTAEEAATLQAFALATYGCKDQNYDRVITASQSSTERRQKLLVFGAPYLLKEYCERLLAGPGPLQARTGSMVFYGGGWKSFEGERIAEADLLELIQRATGIPPSHIVEAYSMTELHALMAKCEHGRFHIPPYLETLVLDDALEPISGDNAFGTFAVLDPFATSYPGFLITGDRVRRQRDACACGLVGDSLTEVGRAPGREVKGCGGIMAAANGAAA